MRNHEAPPGRGLSIVDSLGRRSTLIFTLLALLAGCAYYLLASQTADERASAAEINLAGRRRMLSQHIGLLASQLQRRPDRDDAEALARAAQEMAEIHQTLLEGTPDRRIRPLPQALQADLQAGDGAHAQIRRFIELSQELSRQPQDMTGQEKALSQLVELSRGPVLTAVDQLVGSYQRLSENKSDALRQQQWLVLIAALALLAYSALGVLRPLIIQVRRTLADLASSETALRQTMAENRLILDTTDEGLFGVDRHGRIRFINPAAAQMLGIQARELAGLDHHPSIIEQRDHCPICTALAQGSRQKIESSVFIRHRPGERSSFAVEYSVVPRPDGQGAVISFRDISARLAAEERVQRIRQRLVDAVEAMDDAFALFDADDRLSLYNLRFTEFFPLPGDSGPLGLSFAEFISTAARLGLYAQLPADLDAWLEERLAAHRTANGSIEIACADGRWLRATERRTREGGTVVIWSDVTHLKHALIAADRGSRAKSEFLSRMSHELRTPLNAILGFAQVLELGGGSSLKPDQQEYVGHILQGGRHLLSLINEVLDLSAIEAGKLSIDHQEVNLGDLCRECLSLISPLAANRDITLRQELPSDATVLADRKRLKQVLLNLLSNAIKYNRPAGEVRVEASSDGDWLRLEVHDTGQGISHTQAERVFQPFERLGREEIEGTGIGLAITRRLVELMGGEIGFDSQPGQGTCFWLRLPAACRTTVPTSGPRASSETAALPAGEPGQALISVGVDDHHLQLLELICRTLGQTRLLAFAEAAPALQAASHQACLAIIAAPPALASLQGVRDKAAGRPPLIALSAADTAPDAADLHHPLPLNPRLLARTLRELAHAS
ncbi:ATP-binding protein [Dechloromonas sp. ZY10]|uniref:ATP-binding protein n=1 Tax=Dechloromonas aquae TaxID=2664436 RepID=UPI003527E0F2